VIGTLNVGSYTSICGQPIPINDTYLFTAEYTFTGDNGGHIGVVRADKNFEESMGYQGSWAVRSNGVVYLDSKFHSLYFSTHFCSPCVVGVKINISQGWIEFSLNGISGARLYDLSLPNYPLHFACSTIFTGVSWKIIS